MTEKKDRALRNAMASAHMEGLSVSAQTERDCERYLDGRIDADTLVHEALKRYHSQKPETRR